MNRKAFKKKQIIHDYFQEAKSYTVKRSKVSDENQKTGATIEKTAFSERNKLTRDKEKQYKTYLKWKLGCEDVRIHNWKLVDLSNEYKEKTRSKLDDQLPDVIVEFSCKGYFHNKFNISYNEIKDNKDILEVMYSVYEYDQLDLNITDKEILKQQIKKTTLWISEKKRELQKTEDNQKLRKKIARAEKALADANKLVQGPKQVMKPHSRDALPQFDASEIEQPVREAFVEQFGNNEILTKNNNDAYVNDIELNVADPFDYLRWWYQQYENMSKLKIMEGIVNRRKPKKAKDFQRKIGYKFQDLQEAFKDAQNTLNPNEPNEDPIIRLFDTTNLSTSEKKIAEFGTPINDRTMGDLFTLKYKGVFYYVMVDAEDKIEIKKAKYLNKQAKEAEETKKMEKEDRLVNDSDGDSIQSDEERSDDDEDYIYSSYSSDSDEL